MARVRCGCPRCSVRGMMGAVILITIGVLFLIDKINWNLSFGRLWPAILIVIGIVKVAEAMASTEGHQSS